MEQEEDEAGSSTSGLHRRRSERLGLYYHMQGGEGTIDDDGSFSEFYERVLFPAGLELLSGEELLISFGYNDIESYFLRCRIDDLLDTMADV